MDREKGEEGGSRKRGRCSSSSSTSSDPDGSPALLHELLVKRPDLVGVMEDYAESRSRVRAKACAAADRLLQAASRQASPTQGHVHGSPEAAALTPERQTQAPPDSASVRRLPSTPSDSAASSRRTTRAVAEAGSQGVGGKVSAAQKGKRLMFVDAPGSSSVLPSPSLASPASAEIVYSGQSTLHPRTMHRPQMEPLRLFRGRSFLKHFTSPFKSSIDVPYDFARAALEDGATAVILFGDVLMGFEVEVEFRDGKAEFREGWHAFAYYERIGRGDTAVFALLGVGSIGMRLYGPDGDHKPLSMCPEHGHELLNDFPPANQEVNVAAPAVPPMLGNLLGLQWELGHGVVVNGEILETLSNVRRNRDMTLPLYVCNITRTHVAKNPHFYFSSSFSRFLRNQTPANLCIADDPYGRAAVISRIRDNDEVARIFIGWPVSVAHAPIVAGATYVVYFSEVQGVYNVRFFPIGYMAD